ncbi:MAG: hypothetical protein PVJ21_10865 [Anaerolineales bacterium]|jgi:hypothetical protein
MTNAENLSFAHKKYPYLWISALCLGTAFALARLNIYLGTQMNYLDYLALFNTLTIAMLVSVGIAIFLSIAGLWQARFKSIPLVLVSLASSAFLILLFLID